MTRWGECCAPCKSMGFFDPLIFRSGTGPAGMSRGGSCPAVGAAPLKAGQAKINSDKPRNIRYGTGWGPALRGLGTGGGLAWISLVSDVL